MKEGKSGRASSKAPAVKTSSAAPPAAAPVAKAAKKTRKAATKKTAKKLTVADLMSATPRVCTARDDLGSAARSMWSGDCGALPVVDEAGRPVGWITDRDISMALAMQNARPSEMAVKQVMNAPVHACAPEDGATDALRRMEEKQIRRLAVVGADGTLVGVLSLHDLVGAAKARAAAGAPSTGAVVDALRAIGKPWEAPEPAGV